jgi:hypothetical protein
MSNMYHIVGVEKKYNTILDMVRDATFMDEIEWYDEYDAGGIADNVVSRSNLKRIYDDVQDEIIKSCIKKVMKELKSAALASNA